MLDATIIRENPDRVKKGITSKNADPKLVDAFLELDARWRALRSELDGLRAEQKKLSGARDIESGKKNKELIKAKEEEIRTLEAERQAVWERIPNLPSEDTPVGKDESENTTLRTWGEPRKFDFEPKDHVALGEALGLINVEGAVKAAGARFNYLLRGAALLHHALVQYALGILTHEDSMQSIAQKVRPGYSGVPFVPVVIPVMIRPDVFQKMARLEPKEERYYIPSDDVYLVGSAEHTLGPLHMDEAIPEADLPKRYVAFSTAFRREAGSYGKDTRGILRQHQFEKIEMESFTAPENGVLEQDFFVAIQEYLVQSLGIPYRVVAICTGDMGSPDARQIDIEMWMPGEGKYRETHTSDYMTDYQARRLNTKVKRGGKTEFVHMNDATVFATGRTIIAILENCQTKDGTVVVPEVLHAYGAPPVIK